MTVQLIEGTTKNLYPIEQDYSIHQHPDVYSIMSFLSDDRKWSLLYNEETGVLVLLFSLYS